MRYIKEYTTSQITEVTLSLDVEPGICGGLVGLEDVVFGYLVSQYLDGEIRLYQFHSLNLIK